MSTNRLPYTPNSAVACPEPHPLLRGRPSRQDQFVDDSVSQALASFRQSRSSTTNPNSNGPPSIPRDIDPPCSWAFPRAAVLRTRLEHPISAMDPVLECLRRQPAFTTPKVS